MRLNLLLASVAAVAMAAPLTTAAQTPQQNQPVEVEIDQGVLRPLQIAVVPFAGTHGSDISNVVSANLKRSGFFEPLNPSSFIETGLTLANAPNFPQWTQIGAQAVLYGGVTTRGDGRLDVGFRLYDPYRQCQLVSYQFTATQEQWRRIAHKISDVIYQRMTGESGFFDSRVIFVSEEGTQLNRINRLTIADQDGFNPTYLTQGDEVIMSPRFSLSQPDEITYVALARADAAETPAAPDPDAASAHAAAPGPDAHADAEARADSDAAASDASTPAADACAADQGPADPAPGDARTRPPRAPARRAEPGFGRPGRTDAPDQQSRPPGDGAAGGGRRVPGHGPADHGHLQSGLSELDPALRHPRRGPAAHPGRTDPVGRRADHARPQPDQRPVVERLPRRRRRRPARPAPDRALRRAAGLPRRGLSPDLQHRTGVP